MQYRHLGNSGVQVSVIGVGCNRIGRTVDLEGTKAIAHRALDEGINFFDTADVYGAEPGGSETILGAALEGLWDRLVLGTKVRAKMGEGVNDHGASRYHILNGAEASLRRLKTDHIDLYYIHSWDEGTPLQETLRALEDLVHSGKVRYIGASNFASWQLAAAHAISELRGWNEFVVTQEEYHMLERGLEREVIPYARYIKLGIVPYFPLAGGFLTGKYGRGDAISPTRTNYVAPYMTDRNFQILDRLRAFVSRRGHTVGELAMAWLLSEPQVCSVISGATNAEQISANAKAADWELSADEVKEVREILQLDPVMSKLYPGSAPPELEPEQQLAYYVQRVRSRVHPASLARIRARARELKLEFSDDDIQIIAALDTPRRVQWFLDNEVYYNNDHSEIADEETSRSPRMLLRTGLAHCFEGALFATAVNYLHGFEPRWMLLEGSRDVDHNLVVYRDKHAVRWGCNAHSGYPHLGGREPEFFTLRELAETYVPYYYSGETNDPNDLTLVGFSEPFDLTGKFGVEWMAQLEPVWDIYYLLVDASWTFYRLDPPFGAQYRDASETHGYTLIDALNHRWIEVQTFEVSETSKVLSRPFVNVNRLPPRAQLVWHEFWAAFDPAGLLPRGRAAELEGEFFKVTGTTPIDLNYNAEELGYFLERGYKVEQLLARE